jgi:hypothetical protein
MTLYNPLFLEAVTGDSAITYHMQDLRLMLSALVPLQGTVLATDLTVSQRSAGANMSVDVTSGRAFIQGTSISNQGNYLVRSDAVTNVGIAAASSSNPRIDLIVARVFDKQADGGSSYSWTLQSVTGTPAASPVAPSVPPSSLLLAQVAVATSAASITNANITDKRTLSGQIDIPGWQLSGGDGQVLPANTETMYAPTNNTLLGTTWTPGTGVTIVTPGRYFVSWGGRINAATGSTIRGMSVTQNRGGTELRRFTSQIYQSAITEHSTSGTFQCFAGDIIKPLATVSGAASAFSDGGHQMSCSGFWLGP